jgi:hypothetical protein
VDRRHNPAGISSPPNDTRAGFSLIEALIVLIVGAMALVLVFSVGGKSNETAFRLGRRALMAADGRLGSDSVSAIIAGVDLAPIDPSAGADEDRRQSGFVGGPDGFRADVITETATPCAAAGPARNLRLDLVRGQGGTILTCRVGDGAPTVLLDLGARRAAFSYSLDGEVWADRWTERGAAPLTGSAAPRERRLFVRLASEDGAVEITGRASSDRPELQPHRQQVGPTL